MINSMKIAITALLVENGWKAEDGAAVASKYYETAVGLKVAFIYVGTKVWPDTDRILITSEYQSEGRDALSTTFSLISLSLTAEQLKVQIVKYLKQVDYAVSQTYAAKLHNSRITRIAE